MVEMLTSLYPLPLVIVRIQLTARNLVVERCL